MHNQKKKWIKLKDRTQPEYLKGVDDFLEFAFSYAKSIKSIRPLCCKCNNVCYKIRDRVKDDLLKWGFEPTYKCWEYHGESSADSSSDSGGDNNDDNDFGASDERSDDAQTYSMLHDMYQSSNMDKDHVFDQPMPNNIIEKPNGEAKKFYGLLKDADKNYILDVRSSPNYLLLCVFFK